MLVFMNKFFYERDMISSAILNRLTVSRFILCHKNLSSTLIMHKSHWLHKINFDLNARNKEIINKEISINCKVIVSCVRHFQDF